MKILVWGLGYVGTVSAVCFAQLGHEVIGIDINPTKVESVNSGACAVKEPGLSEAVNKAVKDGHLRATQEGSSLVPWADVSLICVGTPSAADGSQRLDYLRGVAIDIGRGLSRNDGYHVVIVRSTLFAGTTRRLLLPLLEQYSGLKAGQDFGLVANPEFLREATAISDFYTPPYTIIGELDSRSGEVVQKMYERIEAPVYRVSVEEAELLKVVNNVFHALKIGFANEIGRVCEKLDLNGEKIMDLVCADSKLNISAAYLKPGFAFGGSCLPKDVRAMVFNSNRLGVDIPIMQNILSSNTIQVEAARIKIDELRARCIAILGLSFKPGTDDLRESPVVKLVRDLWQDGVDIMVYDPDIVPEQMLGSNREYLERQLPQINQILKPHLAEVLKHCDAVVITQNRPEFSCALQTLDPHIPILDLVRADKSFERMVVSS